MGHAFNENLASSISSDHAFKAGATIARKSPSSLLLSALSFLYAITCHCLPRAQTTQSF
jgi:hypothetical protein